MVNIGKHGKLSGDGVLKKYLKEEYQFPIELVNKVLLPHSEKCIVASATNLLFMNSLSKFEDINLPALMIEHMYKVMTVKDKKHEMYIVIYYLSFSIL